MQLFLALSVAPAVAVTRQFPSAKDWPIGAVPWPASHQNLAPAAVVDLCGGSLGTTQWTHVSEPCAIWVAKMSKCQQACATMNRFQGFGACLATCTDGPPDPKWCEETPTVAGSDVVTYCNAFVQRWNQNCEISSPKYASYDDWANAIDGCYSCTGALDLELSIGVPLGWRARKCFPEVFQCAEAEDSCHRVADNFVCAPPVGLGSRKCYFDDPTCAGSTCIAPAPTPPPPPAPSTGDAYTDFYKAGEKYVYDMYKGHEDYLKKKEEGGDAASAADAEKNKAEAKRNAQLKRRKAIVDKERARLEAVRAKKVIETNAAAYEIYEEQLMEEAESQQGRMTPELWNSMVEEETADAKKSAQAAFRRNKAGHEVPPADFLSVNRVRGLRANSTR